MINIKVQLPVKSQGAVVVFLLLPVLLQKVEDVADRLKTRELLVGDDDAVLLLDGHQHLQDVEAVRAEIFFDTAFLGDLHAVQMELFIQNLL